MWNDVRVDVGFEQIKSLVSSNAPKAIILSAFEDIAQRIFLAEDNPFPVYSFGVVTEALKKFLQNTRPDIIEDIMEYSSEALAIYYGLDFERVPD